VNAGLSTTVRHNQAPTRTKVADELRPHSSWQSSNLNGMGDGGMLQNFSL